MPDRIFSKAVLTSRLWNEAISPASPTISIDISRTASSASPIDLSIAPIVPLYCCAEREDIPKLSAAASAHWYICSAPSPKVVSTTFCTSVRLEASSIPLCIKFFTYEAASLNPSARRSPRTLDLSRSPNVIVEAFALSRDFA